MHSLFSADQLLFPYNYSFPGQNSDECILYATREDPVMLQLHRAGVVVVGFFLFIAGWVLAGGIEEFIGGGTAFLLRAVSVAAAITVATVGWWWMTTLWKQSIALVTNRRLHKFIASTPWTRHSLSLPLEMIVDLGAYSKGFWQAVLKLGTFTARSSASSSGVATDDPERVNKKYFYIENIAFAEDLQHYVQKVLFMYRQDWQTLATFRPFIPITYGQQRKELIEAHPEYWS